jgi:predicted DNA-binding protein with PD1-like motif
MKVKQLQESAGLRTFALVMDKGDDAADQLVAFARQPDWFGWADSRGACRAATIGYFDPKIMDDRTRAVEGKMEVLSLVGDIATKDGEPAVHAHVVLGRSDYSTIGGHLHHLTVFPTMEVIATETPGHLAKRIDPETGLALIAMDVDDERAGTG